MLVSATKAMLHGRELVGTPQVLAYLIAVLFMDDSLHLEDMALAWTGQG
jgi:hypothetical protein